MKKRMKELMAFLLVICMAFGSVGTTGYAAADTGETGTENVDGEGPAPGEESVPGQEDGGAPGEPEPQASAEPEEGETGENAKHVVYNYNYPVGSGLSGESKTVELPSDGQYFIIGNDSGIDKNAQGYEFTKWYGYSDKEYEDGQSIKVEEFISSFQSSVTDNYELTAGWSQTIPVITDGAEVLQKVSEPIKCPAAPAYDGKLTFEKWELNGKEISLDTEVRLEATTNGHITTSTGHIGYDINTGNWKAEFVSYWKPSEGYLIKIKNETGQDIVIDGTVISTGTGTDGPVGIFESLDGYYTANGMYKIDAGPITFQGDVPVYVEYEGRQVASYTYTVSQGNLKRCIELIYEPQTSDVTFAGDNLSGDTVELENISGSETIQDLQAQSAVTASRPGYTFIGWSYSKGDGGQLEETAALPGDCAQIICTPVWGGTVTFHSNYPDVNFPMDDPKKITSEAGMAVNVLPMEDSHGKYRFLGWADSPDASAAQYTESYTVTGNADLYGVWTAQEYTLTWKDIESTEYWLIAGNYTENTYGSEAVPYGSPIETPEDPVKPGYVFLGWDGYNNGSGVEGADPGETYSSGHPFPDTAFMPARDAQIVATWQPVIYSVVYDGNGADLGVPEAPEASCYYGDEIKLPTLIPSRSGYTFAGWEYGGSVYPAGGTFTIPEAEYNEDFHAQLTLTAAWTPNRHTVSYDGAGATSGVPGSHEAEYNSSVTAAAGPVRDGYVFDGWEQISTGDRISAGASFIMPDMDETLRAMWKIAWSRFGGPGTYYLVGGQEYGLDFKAGVEGDEGQYESGISFYVPVSGYYTFTE